MGSHLCEAPWFLLLGCYKLQRASKNENAGEDLKKCLKTSNQGRCICTLSNNIYSKKRVAGSENLTLVKTVETKRQEEIRVFVAAVYLNC